MLDHLKMEGSQLIVYHLVVPQGMYSMLILQCNSLYSTVVLYIKDHGLSQKMLTRNQPHNTFGGWLGRIKPKSVFRVNENAFDKFFLFLFIRFLLVTIRCTNINIGTGIGVGNIRYQ